MLDAMQVGQASSLSGGAPGCAPVVEDRQDAGRHCKMPVATRSFPDYMGNLLLGALDPG
jgi:hypothetical protein